MRIHRVSVTFHEHGAADVLATIPPGVIACDEVTLLVPSEGEATLNTLIWELREEVDRLARAQIRRGSSTKE